MTRGETFLGRWSRMKQEGEPQPPEETPVAVPPDAAPVEDTRTDEEILSDLGLPHPEELKPGDDVSGFMAQAVPAKMKRMALRQLWKLNPVLANVDGLVEYGEDYTDSAMVVENMQTLYQVGKGMFVEPDEPEEEDLPDAEAVLDSSDEDSEDDPEAVQEADPETQELVEEGRAEAAMEFAGVDAEPDPVPQHTRRRMRFD